MLMVFTGLILYTVFAETIGRAPRLMSSNKTFIKQIIFPIEILPAVVIGAALVKAVVSFVLLIAAYFIFIGVPTVTAITILLVVPPAVSDDRTGLVHLIAQRVHSRLCTGDHGARPLAPVPVPGVLFHRGHRLPVSLPHPGQSGLNVRHPVQAGTVQGSMAVADPCCDLLGCFAVCSVVRLCLVHQDTKGLCRCHVNHRPSRYAA